jgi:hypothetical protein
LVQWKAKVHQLALEKISDGDEWYDGEEWCLIEEVTRQ